MESITVRGGRTLSGQVRVEGAKNSALKLMAAALLAPGAENQFIALIATLAGVFVSGLAWTWVATRLALRGEMLKALRNE